MTPGKAANSQKKQGSTKPLRNLTFRTKKGHASALGYYSTFNLIVPCGSIFGLADVPQANLFSGQTNHNQPNHVALGPNGGMEIGVRA